MQSRIRRHHKRSNWFVGVFSLGVPTEATTSQHRNKTLALDRLRSLAEALDEADRETRKARQNRLHHELERGNPVRSFKGKDFSEET